MNHTELYIFLDTGYCLYKKSASGEYTDKGYQNILQALFHTSIEVKAEISCVSTECGTISYKSHQVGENSLLFVLLSPNFFADQELATLVLSNLLELLVGAVIMSVGLTDLTYLSDAEELDKAKTLLSLQDSMFVNLLNSTTELTFLLLCEEKAELSKESLLHLKLFSEKLFAIEKTELYCFTLEDKPILHSTEWLNFDVRDRILLNGLSKSAGRGTVSEIPFYFAFTQLEDNMTGKVPYKLVTLNLTEQLKLCVVCGLSKDIYNLSQKFQKLPYDSKIFGKLNDMKAETLVSDSYLAETCNLLLVGNTKKGFYKFFSVEERAMENLQSALVNAWQFSSFHTEDFCEFYVVIEGVFYFCSKDYEKLLIFAMPNEGNPFEEIDNIRVQKDKLSFDL